MTAVLEVAEPPVPDPVQTLCACGCGEQVNPLLAQAVELRGHNLTFREIGARLGATPQYVRTLVRTPPRYVRGHQSRAAKWVTRACEDCGEEFRTTATSNRTYCKSRYCTSSQLHSAAHEQFIARLDEREDQEREQRREALSRERELRQYADELLTVPACLAERLEQREINIAAARLWLRSGREPWWWPNSRKHRSDGQYEGELRELVEQQAREMRFEDVASFQWMVQLDAPIRYRFVTEADFAEGPATYLDKLAGGDGDPLDVQIRAEEARVLDGIMGDLDIAGVTRLMGYDLERLQERLREAGLASRGVQRKERERLRRNEPRRGSGAPARTRSAMTTRHKHRKPGHQKSAGSKRGARKARKRWSEVEVW